MNELNDILDTLLGENGCPWDKKQTHESMKPYLLEEAREVIDAIDTGDMRALQEELGDVLLQVIFHSKLAEKAGAFTLQDVISTLCEKLIRRHSHVFGDDIAVTEEEVLRIWAKNKQKEKA
ncbi:MAG: nucleotide pyrophosphohydrolase [Defluviitaleaceae bacterium]|nr:nucleotide pyrophosphohydrolase [Defluviitaleaceae bacterium]MCL2274267.1 nucleotide pyrophosphohydrolase [Defluviitaleaceae bacterium]